MHELSMCWDIVKIVTAKTQSKKVKKIWLNIGELAGVDGEAIKFSFPIAAKNTVAEQALLEMNYIPAKGQCYTCQKEIYLTTLFDACPTCRKYDYEITQGKELHLLKVEVE